MIRALWIYLKARFRMIGRCPPHRYEPTEKERRMFGEAASYPFCLDCGKYRA